MKEVKIKVSTITMSTRFPDCTINLTNVGKYLNIDETIIGLKYSFAEVNVTKGIYSTTVYKKAKVKDATKINKALFYNQVSLIVNNSGNHVNVKLFGNGSLHLTGCKTIEEGTIVTRKLYEKLCLMNGKTDTVLLTRDTNGVYIDKDNLVYSSTDKQIIGYLKKNLLDCYVIKKKEYDVDKKTGMYITKNMETQRRRTLVNFDGEICGFTRIELLKNKHKFYKKNVNVFFDDDSGLIYYNNDNILGKVVYHIDNTNKLSQLPSTQDDIIELEYDCSPFNVKSSDNCYKLNTKADDFSTIIDANVNCMNVYFNIDFNINRQRLYEKLIEMNYICKYKPESYSGIKLMYKLPAHYNLDCKTNSSVGYCSCSSKCTCANTTFLIFQSGNVIATGFKNFDQVSLATSQFIALCRDNQSVIQKRVME
jgi:TATA-box binding protein (TBP) (component of TFIID and TFIIIB)